MGIGLRKSASLVTIVFGLTTLSTTPLLGAGNLSPEEQAEVEKSVAAAKLEFDRASKAIQELAARLRDIESQIIKLSDKDSVLLGGKTTVDLLGNDLSKIEKEIQLNDNKKKEILESLKYISRQIIDIRNKKIADRYALFLDTMEHLVSMLADQELQAYDRGKPEAEQASAKASELISALSAYLASDEEAKTVAKIGSQTTKLKAAIEKASPTVIANNALKKRINGLSNSIFSRYPSIKSKKVDADLGNIGTAANNLKTTLDELKKPINSPLRNHLTNTANDGATNLHALGNSILELELNTRQDLVVRIVQAYFGDTFQPQFEDCTKRPEASRAACGERNRQSVRKRYIAKRWCNATSAMINQCDRKKNCTLPTNYETALCGYNPARSAEQRTRGVYVIYDCVKNFDSNFSGPYLTAGLTENTDPIPAFPDSEYMVLRGTTASITCSR